MTQIYRFFHIVNSRSISIIAMMAVMLCFLLSTRAQAMMVIEQDKFYVYYPRGEAPLAERILAACGPMTAFLGRRGLPVATPLHIVIDETLDEPRNRTTILPHREIRIPIRAPGVMEDGCTEADPWTYFLFMGLTAHGIYQERSGIPKAAHSLMGELISPNVVLPNWGEDGIAFLLYEEYQQRPVAQPFAEALFTSVPVPDLDLVSHHPNIWPGRFMYRVYGRPFVRWLNDHYGWQKILKVLKHHGAGILPIEIDREAREAFGMSWNQLWRRFQADHRVETAKQPVKELRGLPIIGYWPASDIYWYENGIYQGLKSDRLLGRYGFRDQKGSLWLSGYDGQGILKLVQHYGNTALLSPQAHFWDPGPGMVAVTRKGRRPFLAIRPKAFSGASQDSALNALAKEILIEAPLEVIQLSGPMMDASGRVVVAANTSGNWDIWLYDERWYRLTSAPSMELDPWLTENGLVYASNISGRFQIHSQGMHQLTHVNTQALLPRGITFLQLHQDGWRPNDLTDTTDISPLVLPEQEPSTQPNKTPGVADKGRPYTIWPSITTNYVIPDIFVDSDNFQFGLATTALDITKEYAWNAGIRYSTDRNEFSWHLGAQAKDFKVGISRYPFSYATQRATAVNEMRWDFKLAWTPPWVDFLELSANYRQYWSYLDSDLQQEESWATISSFHQFGSLQSIFHLEFFSDESLSFSSALRYRLDWSKFAVHLRLDAGKTWGELNVGHNTFRIGGNTGEGIFTQRTPRLFPIRGFEANILDADQALAGGVELHWPLANLQTGYRTLPLFVRDIILVGFVDAGLATDKVSSDEVLVSIGLEAITGVELAWILNTEIRIGLAWPMAHPDDLQQEGPTFLIQVGNPL